ncbi:GGDEF domain-containing protein [Pseudonocardia sp. GCM10023141]|uniref:GGDEF domain-containing protein n=1 Tax=Pseudonocardia sp. GCM10023141 TaxID=3252653 RepID=UPI003606A2DD
MLTVILLVEVTAVVTLLATASSSFGYPLSEIGSRMAVLVIAAVLSTEASLGVERVRHRSDEAPHIDLSSVWAFAAAALLPPLAASGVVLLVYTHIYVRIWYRSEVPLHRVVFSTATVVLAVQAAAAVMGVVSDLNPFQEVTGLFSVVLAVFAYAAVNMVLVVAVIVLSGPVRNLATFLQVLGHGDEAVLEFATLSMGALVAGAMASFGIAYAILVLPPLIVLHRSVLVRQLEEAASIDGKTGLLNAAAWHVQASRELRRAERARDRAAVLVLDLDHFKLVNDRYGHLVGDVVLAAVAAAVRSEVRDEDVVGRFGGEEFVVLLRGIDGDCRLGTHAAAERIRRRVAALRVEVIGPNGPIVIDDLTVSIGGAVFPPDGLDIAPLLEIADAAMYDAKNRGRNRVRMGLPA